MLAANPRERFINGKLTCSSGSPFSDPYIDSFQAACGPDLSPMRSGSASVVPEAKALENWHLKIDDKPEHPGGVEAIRRSADQIAGL
jgi:hypothetical protein